MVYLTACCSTPAFLAGIHKSIAQTKRKNIQQHCITHHEVMSAKTSAANAPKFAFHHSSDACIVPLCFCRHAHGSGEALRAGEGFLTCSELKSPSLRTELYLPKGGSPGGVGIAPNSSCRVSAPGKLLGSLDIMRLRAVPGRGAERFEGPEEKA